MKKRKQRYAASFTVEAAFVCPIMIFSIFLVIYLGMYAHDRIVCQAICEEALYSAQEARREGKDVEAAAISMIRQQERYLFWADDVTPKVTILLDTIKVRLDAEMIFPFPYPAEVGEVGWQMSGEAVTTAMHPASWIRAKNMIKEELGVGNDA